jgi:hypothetical protein
MATVSDITENKIAEQELKRLHSELENFVYKASHDLKGPLASILGLTNLALDEVQDQAALPYLQMTNQSARKLDANLHDFLHTIRLRNADPQWEEIQFESLVREALAAFSKESGYDEVSVRLKIVPDFRMYSDRDMLASILHHLIDNSIKYRDANKYQCRLTIKAMPAKETGVCLVIEDNGLGMSQDVQGKAFDMFYRASVLSKGTGLGLYVVKNTVEKLNGVITLESAEAIGTRYTIHLPVPTCNPSMLTAVADVNAVRASRRRKVKV